MVMPGEVHGVNNEYIGCEECSCNMKLQVCKSAAGYYLGYWCPECGPNSRETGYFATEEEAEKALLNPTPYLR